MKKDNQELDDYIEGAFGPFFLSLADIRPYFLNPEIKESQMISLIQEMSTKFTKKRDQIGDYVLDEDRVSSYTALYLPTNIPKLHFLLSKLPKEMLDDISSRPFIDIGCGPGTYALGINLLLKGKVKDVTCVDSSKVMLAQAQKIVNGFFPDVNLKTQHRYREVNSSSVLFYGHSINEIGIDQVEDQILTVDPEYVIFIEPGTSALFTELKKLREDLISRYDVIYPCPSNKACPSSWCHQVLRTAHDSSIERLSQLVSLDRKILPMTAHVYRKKCNDFKERNEATIVRFIIETKFSFEYEVCLFNNGTNENVIFEIQKKHLSKSDEKMFKNFNVGEKINFTLDKLVGGKWRVKLSVINS